ncbi:MAG: hypothetical protein V4642_11655 [Bacteroidota bacterium]
MKTKIATELEGKTLPVFALVKNIKLENPAKFPDTEILDFEEIHFSYDKNAPILNPPIPEISKHFKELKEKFGNTLGLKYVTSPLNLSSENSDKKIFGTTYTRLIIFPADTDFTVDYIIKWADKNRLPNGKIDLFTLWTDFLDWMYFVPQINFSDLEQWFFPDEFETRINQLSNPPTDSDWEALENYMAG